MILLRSSNLYRVLCLVQLFLILSLARSILLLSHERLSDKERTCSAGEIEAFCLRTSQQSYTDEGDLPICVPGL